VFSKERGSRATVIKSSSSVFLPYSRGKIFGSPSSRILPCDKKRTRSQIASTSYMLCEVHSTPAEVWVTNSRILRRISRATAGSRDAVGSSNKRRCG